MACKEEAGKHSILEHSYLKLRQPATGNNFLRCFLSQFRRKLWPAPLYLPLFPSWQILVVHDHLSFNQSLNKKQALTGAAKYDRYATQPLNRCLTKSRTKSNYNIGAFWSNCCWLKNSSTKLTSLVQGHFEGKGNWASERQEAKGSKKKIESEAASQGKRKHAQSAWEPKRKKYKPTEPSNNRLQTQKQRLIAINRNKNEI